MSTVQCAVWMVRRATALYCYRQTRDCYLLYRLATAPVSYSMLEHTTESISSRVRPHKTGLVNIVSQEPSSRGTTQLQKRLPGMF